MMFWWKGPRATQLPEITGLLTPFQEALLSRDQCRRHCNCHRKRVPGMEEAEQVRESVRFSSLTLSSHICPWRTFKTSFAVLIPGSDPAPEPMQMPSPSSLCHQETSFLLVSDPQAAALRFPPRVALSRSCTRLQLSDTPCTQSAPSLHPPAASLPLPHPSCVTGDITLPLSVFSSCKLLERL